MQQTFYKYQGTGNDFVMIDNRQELFDKTNTKHIAFLCDRRFGIGADGLILLENHIDLDFKMVYYNADGNESSMCGNGGRCLVAFAKYLGIVFNKAVFEAVDGIHHAEVENNMVKLQMQDVHAIEKHEGHVFLNTGSPHHVQFEEHIEDFDIRKKGSKIRYGEPYNEAGSNVNFVKKISEATFAVRTYERGVEDETLSCGTGVTAVALAMNYLGETNQNLVTLQTKGGDLKVSFKKEGNSYKNVWLIGSAKFVFKGTI
ncbi:MAG: diaminopimelate epimerase [Flavobacteriales bacterium]|nr:diaminopimelate epimerase [Flavobacteriia bacterium]NCP07025.1 diaminopimelate epimerase [Flavobacteriales bacterium]PIV93542.1 MAG: diaminopimelate epimerase [Flavobacteriaceae bacterium CG17_big_fil_post_rev_8_21_14_2_50_33_15]PIY09695.1 MAG: diaminopimelate epimerase [Flavobacteriaceae bacterium CG_4_10_14_3_um_filter_33_47]PJB16581.1 MAG: diaminopimelate epimerase [Flavobacteriaceae bacterium CG_4_9_14_3_um_filter_33_16]